MTLHRQEKRVTSKLWTTFLSMLVRSGHGHLLKSLKRQILPPFGKYLSSKWIKGNVSRRILVLDTSLLIHFDDKYFRTEGVENRVGDDGVRAILQYRPSDLYLMDRKETMAILQKYTHTSLHVRK